MFNLAVLGGGPAGYTAAERAAQAGLNVVLFEKNALGGTCLNVGCIPTKTLLYSSKLYYNAVNGSKYGIKAEGVQFEYDKIVARKNKVVRKLIAGIKAKAANGISAAQLAEIYGVSTSTIYKYTKGANE